MVSGSRGQGRLRLRVKIRVIPLQVFQKPHLLTCRLFNLLTMHTDMPPELACHGLGRRSVDDAQRAIACWQGVSNNYETDLLRPIMDRAAELAGISYETADEKSRTSLKVMSLSAMKCSRFVSTTIFCTH